MRFKHVDTNNDVIFCFSGTRNYAPPEFFKGQKYFASSTTVWQVGALLFELVTGADFDGQLMSDPRLYFPQKSSKSKLS